ncbi:MAG: hypothetical protein AAF483_16375 [Planctomycetota bacterium]
MRELTLEAIRDFHGMLRCISESGFEVEISEGNPLSRSGLDRELLRIEDSCSTGLLSSSDAEKTLCAKLESDSATRGMYLKCLTSWLRGGQAATCFGPLIAGTLERERFSGRSRLQMFYPIMWGTLGCIVLVFVSFFLAPMYLNLARQLNYQSPLFNLIAAIGPWLPILVLLEIFAIWGYMKSAFRKSQVSGKQELLRRSNDASVTADLLERDAQESEGKSQSVGESAALLQWAHSEDQELGDRPTKLRFASEVYRSIHAIHQADAAKISPSRLSIVFGGAIAITVGLFVFLPIIELLMMVIRTSGAGA